MTATASSRSSGSTSVCPAMISMRKSLPSSRWEVGEEDHSGFEPLHVVEPHPDGSSVAEHVDVPLPQTSGFRHTSYSSIRLLSARAYANSPLPCMNRSPSTSSFSFGIDSSRSPASRVAFHSRSPDRVLEITYFGSELTMSAHLPDWLGQYPARPSKVLRPSTSPLDLA